MNSQDYFMWLLVLSFILAFAIGALVILFILVMAQRRREQSSKEQYIQLRELFRQYIDSGAGGGGGGGGGEPVADQIVEGSPYYSATQVRPNSHTFLLFLIPPFQGQGSCNG